MASAFWTLEDGRTFSYRWSHIARILEIIVDEMSLLKGAEKFHKFLSEFTEKDGDEYNGFGGYYRGTKIVMFNFDFRAFAPKNRKFFWEAAQNSLKKLTLEEQEKNKRIIDSFAILLDMHKRINRGEPPVELNHSTIVEDYLGEKIGPDWK